MPEFEEFDLSSVLQQPTKMRTELVQDEPETVDFSGLEFETSPDLIESNPIDKEADLIEDLDEEEEEEPHDPEEEAEKLVGLIQAANVLTMTPLALWKARKKRGGKAAISKMQIIAAKNFEGAKLEKKEAEQLAKYNAYLKDKEQLENAIPYTSDELSLLKTMAIPYMKTSKIKINGGFAFWTTLAGIQAQRVIAIIQA